jgi:molybdopterin-guanine dinucleotide biosynthesis protein A
MTEARVSGIVLAGGRSSRFPVGAAGGSKLDADLGGMSVLDWTIAAMRSVVDEVVVVGHAAVGDASSTAVPPDGERFVEDTEPFGGPVAGLLVGLDACVGEVVLVAGGDMPLLHAEVLRLLVARLVADPPADAVHLAVAEGWQPLPLGLRREPAMAAATEALGASDRSLVGFVRRLSNAAVAEAEWRAIDPGGDTIADVDTPADLEALRRRF